MSFGQTTTRKHSPVRVLFTGNNRAGSWEIRGNQVASARPYWTATHRVTDKDLKKHDLVCFVKRPQPELLSTLHNLRKPFVFDIIDSWGQPDEGLQYDSYEKVKELFRTKWSLIRADGYIFPNHTMMNELGFLTPVRTAIYHHFRPGLMPIEVNKKARVVGYEGSETFLGEWLGVIKDICAKNDLEFQVNPTDFRQIDIGVAIRGGEHDSYMANHYKSNVKLANFYGAGIPCLVGWKERSYHETDNGDVRFFRSPLEFETQLKSLLDYDTRLQISERFRDFRENFQLEAIASQFEQFFERVYRIHCDRSGIRQSSARGRLQSFLKRQFWRK